MHAQTPLSPIMEEHALSVLTEAGSRGWLDTQRLQESGKKRGRYNYLTSRFLWHLIKESRALGGTVLNQFWHQVGECDARLKDNVEMLPSAGRERTLEVLFEGIDVRVIDFTPVNDMADEYFTHLGVAILNPGGSRSKSGTLSSDSADDIESLDTVQLLAIANDENHNSQSKEHVLKQLVTNRDGVQCPVTGFTFRQPEEPFSPENDDKLEAHLAHIIPNSVSRKPDTLKCLATFAGIKARDLVLEHLSSPGNVMTLEGNAHASYDQLRWGIEAQEKGGTLDALERLNEFAGSKTKELDLEHRNSPGNVMNLQSDASTSFKQLRWGIEAHEEGGAVTYIYRKVPFSPGVGPLFNRLKDGDIISFGKGRDWSRLGGGPLPLLCNVKLAVARVLRMSGAADVIMKVMDDADDSDIPNSYIASDESCDILASKLLLLHS